MSGGKGAPRRVTPSRGARLAVRLLTAACVVLLFADLFYDKHPHFAFEGWFGFYAFFGFVAFFLIVLSGKPLRRLLMRDEDYYDR